MAITNIIPGWVESGPPGTIGSLNPAGTRVEYRDIQTGAIVGSTPFVPTPGAYGDAPVHWYKPYVPGGPGEAMLINVPGRGEVWMTRAEAEAGGYIDVQRLQDIEHMRSLQQIYNPPAAQPEQVRVIGRTELGGVVGIGSRGVMETFVPSMFDPSFLAGIGPVQEEPAKPAAEGNDGIDMRSMIGFNPLFESSATFGSLETSRQMFGTDYSKPLSAKEQELNLLSSANVAWEQGAWGFAPQQGRETFDRELTKSFMGGALMGATYGLMAVPLFARQLFAVSRGVSPITVYKEYGRENFEAIRADPLKSAAIMGAGLAGAGISGRLQGAARRAGAVPTETAMPRLVLRKVEAVGKPLLKVSKSGAGMVEYAGEMKVESPAWLVGEGGTIMKKGTLRADIAITKATATERDMELPTGATLVSEGTQLSEVSGTLTFPRKSNIRFSSGSEKFTVTSFKEKVSTPFEVYRLPELKRMESYGDFEQTLRPFPIGEVGPKGQVTGRTISFFKVEEFGPEEVSAPISGEPFTFVKPIQERYSFYAGGPRQFTIGTVSKGPFEDIDTSFINRFSLARTEWGYSTLKETTTFTHKLAASESDITGAFGGRVSGAFKESPLLVMGREAFGGKLDIDMEVLQAAGARGSQQALVQGLGVAMPKMTPSLGFVDTGMGGLGEYARATAGMRLTFPGIGGSVRKQREMLEPVTRTDLEVRTRTGRKEKEMFTFNFGKFGIAEIVRQENEGMSRQIQPSLSGQFQAMDMMQEKEMRQMLGTKMREPSGPSRPTVIPVIGIPVILRPPSSRRMIRPMPDEDFGESMMKRTSRTLFERKPRYVPSLTAQLLDIRASKEPKPKGGIWTGFEIRPVIVSPVKKKRRKKYD